MRNGFLVNGEPAIDVSKITPIKSLEPKDDHTIDSEHLVNSEIRYDKYIVDKREKQLIFAGTLVVGTSLSVLLYHNIFFSLVLLFFYIKIQEIYAEYMLDRRKRTLAEQFKDFLFILSTSIGAGRGMRDAIGEAIPGIVGIYGENAILSRELKNMHKRMSIGNEEDVTVLNDFAKRSRSEDIVDFMIIYSTCKTTGASLVDALNKAASVIIDKMTIENEIRTMANRKKNESIILFVMPFVVVLFLNLFSPEYIAPLYESYIGRVIMTMVVAADIFIYSVMQKITDVEI
ncbi:type II secretion system F family protein [Mogibacterium diversum]